MSVSGQREASVGRAGCAASSCSCQPPAPAFPGGLPTHPSRRRRDNRYADEQPGRGWEALLEAGWHNVEIFSFIKLAAVLAAFPTAPPRPLGGRVGPGPGTGFRGPASIAGSSLRFARKSHFINFVRSPLSIRPLTSIAQEPSRLKRRRLVIRSINKTSPSHSRLSDILLLHFSVYEI